MPRQPSGRRFTVKRNLYPVDGVDQDWHRFAHGTVALLVEGALHNPASREKRLATVRATRPAWSLLLDRFLRGPTLTIHAKDAAGRPVGARIIIEGLSPPGDEVWTARPRDGRFDRLPPAPGSYRIRARLGDQETQVTRKVGKGRSTLLLRLPGSAHGSKP